MRNRMLKRNCLAIVLATFMAVAAVADPCGMVPPIYTGEGPPITRIGLQKTYVFYKDGVETFVIRPGFEGKVDEFGMLIPFPSVPAIRKAPDDIFAHIGNAIDPPEVVIDLRIRLDPKSSARGFGGNRDGEPTLQLLREDEVRVLKQEAVGMYEVAVLAAGSPEALKKWLDEHGYIYPAGMDEVTTEYIEQKWCFVAVKTKVGEKAGVDPKPGQRDVDSKLKPGSTFDGFVQAMGFRFETEELVVPMRLSAFNAGDLHNVVYIRQFTSVTYQFEAEVDGQRRTFQREGKLRGWHFPVCVQVLYDATDPSDSRMALEASDAHDLLLSLASFLVLGVASFLLSRRLSYTGAAGVSARDKIPPADGTAVGRPKV